MKFSPLSTEEIQLFKPRLAVILAGMGVILAILVMRLWYLQIIQGSYYEEVAKGNRIRVLPLGAPRGIIFDRNGEILAFNRPSFDIQLILEDTPDLPRTLDNLALVTNSTVSQLWDTVNANLSRPKFRPILLLTDVGRKTADLIDTYQEDLPGITVAIDPKRLYPTAFVSSHVLGYVGVINEDQLSGLALSRLRSGRIVGQAGIELIQNDALIGTDGGMQVEVDHVGRVLKVLSRPVNPAPGMDIHLTIDLRLQRYVHSLMSGYKGVIIVSKTRTGEILALISYPNYDPNLFVGGIKTAAWNELVQGEKRPLINKAVQGQYPPGSIFKMVLAAAALDTGAIDETTTLNCPGYIRLNREIRYCWKRSGHGDVNLQQAIAQSCNVFFYQLGLMLGVDTIRQYALMFGFGQPTGVELESEKSGLIPSRAWKEQTLGEKWYDGETLPVAIGQGFVSVTPIQLSSYIGAIANGGLWVRPTILRRIVTPDGREVLSERDLPRATRLLPLPVEFFDIIRNGLVQAVNGKGTARRARSRMFTVAGKTGTSQVVGRKFARNAEGELDESLLPHSLFVGYAPAEDPYITVMVLVEHGESGGRVAAPIAKKILEYYSKHIEPLRSRFPEFSPADSRAVSFRLKLRRAFETASLPRLAPSGPGLHAVR